MSSVNESDQRKPPEHADVAFRPPIMLGVLLVVGFGLRAFVQLSFVSSFLASVLGPILVLAAFAVFFWAVLTMRRGGGSIPTSEPTDVIVNDGPYRYSRNPIYLAMISLLAGIGIWANSFWFVGLAVLDAVLLWWGVISREEAYLERKFGVEYIEYKAKVRRWL